MVYLRICLVSMAAATNGLPLLAQTNLLMGLRVETGETLPASRLVLSERKSSQKLPHGLNATQRVLAFRGNQRQFSIPAGTKTLSLP